MAANRFATMLHRNTNKMAFLLIYTVLEWILIALLLLNALYSYIIAKFASFFGLQPPCVFCTRLDHLFQPGKGQSSYRDLLCDGHAGEISNLGFCAKHRRLSDAGGMCEDCAAFGLGKIDRNAAFLSQKEKDLLCSCCGVIHGNGFYSAYTVLKTEPWDVLECARKDRSVKEEMVEEKEGAVGSEKAEFVREIPSAHTEEIEKQKEEGREEEDDSKGSKGEVLLPFHCDVVEDWSVAIARLPLENIDEGRLLPIELIDSSTMRRCRPRGHDADGIMLQRDASVQESAAVDIGEIAEKQTCDVSCDGTEEKHANLAIEMLANLEWSSAAPILTDKPSEDVSFDGRNVILQEAIDDELVPTIKAKEFEEQRASEEEPKVNEEVNCEISIGSDICDQEQIEHAQINELIPEPDQISESFTETIDREIASVTETEPPKRTARQAKHLAISPVLNEIVQEGMPETPTTPYSIEGFPVLPKRFLLERRESGTESLDGSIASDLDNIEPLTLDRLKAALKAERKSLTALYAELEEERSASAIAASQTMAMITRLQEEKAAMQMEALHYQRMMEEQSEYDQEALQLLNELMMKREKEKQELEEELELYHEKVLIYEARERSKKTGSKKKGHKNGTASDLSSSEESDDVSFEFREGEESDCSLYKNTLSAKILSHVENTDTLDGCLIEFEENRISIFKQLKALVDKLFKLVDEDDTSYSETVNDCWVENGHGVNGECKLLGDDIYCGSVNCSSHDPQTNGKLHGEQRSVGIRGKSLLPLFDAIRFESEEKLSTKVDSIDICSPNPVARFAAGHKQLAFAEEIDQVYKRLQALEAEHDFIKHCISSLKKGKKGMNILQEILQNLNILKSSAPCHEF